MRNSRWLWMLALVGLAACGSAMDTEPPRDDGPPTASIDAETLDARADRPGQWRVRVPGMTMWVDTTLKPRTSSAGTLWLLRGRVSKNLAGFRAFTGRGHHFSSSVASPRTFEVVLDEEEAAGLLAGDRVYFDFFPTQDTQPMYSGTVRFGARFGDWGGDSNVFVYRALNPVLIGSELSFRGRASARKGYSLEAVKLGDDRDPMLVHDDTAKWHFDFTPGQLLRAANASDPVRFQTFDGAERRAEKTAHIDLRLVSLGLTIEPIFHAWPRETCRDEVASCLAELSDADTEPCGWASEVQVCVGEGVVLPDGPTPQRFVTDLREEITRWYGERQRDASAFSAPGLKEVLDQVDVDAVRELDDLPSDEYFEYDPAYYQIYWHPDPILPDSERVWYGVYEPSGKLRAIYLVN